MTKISPKPGYKIEKLRFNKWEEIPETWTEKPLNSFLTPNMGQSPPSKFYNSEKNGLPFVQGVTEFGEIYPEISIWCSKPKKIAEKDEILFSVRAPVAKLNLTKTKLCIGRGIASLKPKKNNDLIYCYYLLQQFKDRFLPFSQGIPYDSINKPALSNIKFPIAEFKEQEKIGSILSNLDDNIFQINEEMKLTNKFKTELTKILLTKGIGNKNFQQIQLNPKFMSLEIPDTWCVVTINDLMIKQNSGLHNRLERDDSGDNIVGMEDLYHNSFVEGQTFTKAKFPSNVDTKKYLLNDNDFLYIEISLVHNGIGKTIMVTKKGVGTFFAGNLRRFSINDRINPLFLYYMLNFDLIRNSMISRSYRTAQTGITKRDYFGTKIPLPPKEEQDKIVKILTNIESKMEKLNQYKFKIIELKKGVMQKVLTSNVRVKF